MDNIISLVLARKIRDKDYKMVTQKLSMILGPRDGWLRPTHRTDLAKTKTLTIYFLDQVDASTKSIYQYTYEYNKKYYRVTEAKKARASEIPFLDIINLYQRFNYIVSEDRIIDDTWPELVQCLSGQYYFMEYQILQAAD